MMETMEHDLKEPCPTVRAGLETMERFPGFQIGILYQVLSLMPVPQEQRGGAIEIGQVWHRHTLEAFDLNFGTKKQPTLRVTFFKRWTAAWDGSPKPPRQLPSIN
jgi:hypothetical protein